MDRSPHNHTDTEPPSDLTLHDAAARYNVSARTLAQHIRCGQLPAYKSAGAHGRQWRITQDALDNAGYPRRVPPTTTDTPEPPLVTKLRRELTAARKAAAAERRRADDLDRRLGHTLLECGHLRTALAAATGTADAPKELYLDAAEAAKLVHAVRGASTGPRLPRGHR